jgi:hypothetical protein
MKYGLAVGGSNMAGEGVGGPSLATLSPLVQVWNNVNDGGADGTAWIASPAAGSAPWRASGGNNSAAWFCDRLAREIGEAVRLVVVAQSSLVIADMQPPSGSRYVKVKSAYVASGAPPADFLLWNNGDALLGSNPSAYEAGFLSAIAGFREDGLLAADAPIIIQGLVGTQASLNGALESTAANHADMFFAPADSLRPFDTVHLCGPDLHYMGFHRCWGAYQQFTGPRIAKGPPLRGAV